MSTQLPTYNNINNNVLFRRKESFVTETSEGEGEIINATIKLRGKDTNNNNNNNNNNNDDCQVRVQC